VSDYVQISAQISERNKLRLDQYARETGVKKSRVVDDALGRHLDVLDEIPAEFIVPATVVLTDESFDDVLAVITPPAEPTPALRDALRRSRAARSAD